MLARNTDHDLQNGNLLSGCSSRRLRCPWTQVLWRLRASLNVAQFKGVFEDDADVHVLMEWCKGGELTSHLGRGHYSERTVRLEGLRSGSAFRGRFTVGALVRSGFGSGFGEASALSAASAVDV